MIADSQEITSMASQLSYVYSANRTSARPFATVLHTSFGPSSSPRLWQKMTKSAWPRWTRSHWWDQGVGEVAKALSPDAARTASTAQEGEAGLQTVTGETDGSAKEATEGEKDYTQYLSGPSLPSTLSPGTHKLVYLSADAEEELTTLSEDEVYVIGGIVDRNRYKVRFLSVHRSMLSQPDRVGSSTDYRCYARTKQ